MRWKTQHPLTARHDCQIDEDSDETSREVEESQEERHWFACLLSCPRGLAGRALSRWSRNAAVSSILDLNATWQLPVTPTADKDAEEQKSSSGGV